MGGEDVIEIDLAQIGVVDYEIVMAAPGFFISINGGVDLSLCTGFSFYKDRHISLATGYGEIILQRVPEKYAEMIASAESIDFVRFEKGELVDGVLLSKLSNGGGHVNR